MDDLTMLRELGREFDPPTAGPPLAARERLLAATRPGARRRPFRPTRADVLRRGAPGLAAAVAGGLALVFLLPSTPTAPAPATPGTTGTDARHVLLAMASTARAQAATPPPPDAFIYSRSLQEWQHRRVEREAWLSVNGRRDGAVVPTGMTNLYRIPACPASGVLVQRTDKGISRMPCTLSPGYRSDIPTDADGAFRLLTKEDSEPFTAFENGAYLLQEGQVPPGSVAAVLEALSRLPGISTVGPVRTLSGRPGLGIVITRRDGQQQGIIVDRGSDRLLGGWTGRRGPAGTVEFAWEGLQKAVVSEVRLRPDGSRRAGPISG